jgi:hypothetical protein
MYAKKWVSPMRGIPCQFNSSGSQGKWTIELASNNHKRALGGREELALSTLRRAPNLDVHCDPHKPLFCKFDIVLVVLSEFAKIIFCKMLKKIKVRPNIKNPIHPKDASFKK